MAPNPQRTSWQRWSAAKKTRRNASFALGIRHVGEEMARRLVGHFRSDRIFTAGKEELMAVPEIGEAIADSIRRYVEEAQNKEFLERLRRGRSQV